MNKRSLILSILLTALLVVPASAEVIDKVLPLPSIWQWSLIASLTGFMVCCYRPLLGIVTFFIIACFLLGSVSEVLDPTIGASIQHEVGSVYILQIIAAPCVVVSHLFGATLNWRKFKST